MKFTFKRLEFLKAYDKLRRSISPVKQNIPAASCIYMELLAPGANATNATIKMATTNLDSTTIYYMDVVIHDVTNDRALINGRLGDLVKAINDTDITMETNGPDAKLTYKGGKSQIHGMDPILFTLPQMKGQPTQFTVLFKDLKTLLGSVGFCTTEDDSRPALKGVKFVVGNGEINSMACDGFRSARKTIALPYNGSGQLEFVIPGHMLNNILSVGDKDDDPIEIKVSTERLSFCNNHGNTTFQGSTLAVAYPNIDKFFTYPCPEVVIIKKAELLSVLDRIHTFCFSKTAPGSDRVMLEFDAAQQEVRLSGQNVDVGQIADSISAQFSSTTANITIHFNTHKLIEGIEPITTENLFFTLSHPEKPAILMPEMATSDYSYVCFPIKIS